MFTRLPWSPPKNKDSPGVQHCPALLSTFEDLDRKVVLHAPFLMVKEPQTKRGLPRMGYPEATVVFNTHDFLDDLGGFPKRRGTPHQHPLLGGIFSSINHPLWVSPMTMESSKWKMPWIWRSSGSMESFWAFL